MAGEKPNWTVTGKYDARDARNAKRTVVLNFNMGFLAKNKADALRQADKFFKEMVRDHPEDGYKNLRNIKATEGF
jgi:hypothetical protein